MTLTELWEWMMEGNYPEGWPEVPSVERKAFAILTTDLHVKRCRGHGIPEESVVLKKGQRVKIVMASRFGDVGITDDLTAENGYIHRIPIDSDVLVDIQPLQKD